MKKYQVIIVLDESRSKSYFYSYVESEDTTLGNIECAELPAYQDINMARACYWDADNQLWVFDVEKYSEICEEIEAIKEAQAEAEAIAEATPTNEELAEICMELAEMVSILSDSVTELAEMVSVISE